MNAKPASGGRSAKGQCFPKAWRLLHTADYRRVYAKGRRKHAELMVAFAMPNGKPCSRIGLTAPRALGGAVVRNRIKRRLREAARRHFGDLGPGWDVVFNPRRGVRTAPFAKIEETVQRIFAAFARRPPAEGDGPAVAVENPSL